MEGFVLAHEAGHCLRLNHVVDDPAISNDTINLMGDGPFEMRTASQIETVLASPLVRPRIWPLTAGEAMQAILDGTYEPFFTRMQRGKTEAFTWEKQRHDSPAAVPERVRELFQEAVLECYADERRHIVDHLHPSLFAALDTEVFGFLRAKDHPNESAAYLMARLVEGGSPKEGNSDDLMLTAFARWCAENRGAKKGSRHVALMRIRCDHWLLDGGLGEPPRLRERPWRVRRFTSTLQAEVEGDAARTRGSTGRCMTGRRALRAIGWVWSWAPGVGWAEFGASPRPQVGRRACVLD
jgi:hypothetical protein